MTLKDDLPQRIDVTTEEIFELLERTKSVLKAEDHALVVRIVQSFVCISKLLEDKETTIQRLRSILFAAKNEKLETIFPQDAKAAKDPQVGSPTPGAKGSEAAGHDKPEERLKEKPKGHGRNGADEYRGAEQIHIPHPSLKPGDPCPDAGCKGKVYVFEPLVLVRVVGQAPLGAKVLTVDQFRCNLCLKIFSACSLEQFGEDKYDASAASMIALMTYGTGVPFYRLAGLQENLGIPLPDATQWDVVERAAKLVAPAFDELIRQAAQGDVLHNDDTPMKILEYMKKKEREDGG